jgi:tetratricopeptide (TPR) repeat protein
MFVLGVGALLAVWLARPIWPDAPERRLERDLRAVRQFLSRSDGDGQQALRLAQRALELTEEFPNRAGEANLLVGTAHLRLAEHAPEHWQAARPFLLEADKLGVPEADKMHLVYRLGKVGFHTGDDIDRVIRRLETSAPHADNRAEAYGLLAQAYLKGPRPNLKKALEANEKQRGVAEVSEAELESAKLLAGELLMKMGKPDEARKVLDKIGKQAPPAILTKARLLLARSYQDEGKWDEAATRYQDALADQRSPLPPDVLPHVYFDLGHCYRRREQPSDAARAWSDCVKHGKDTPEGQAASLLLAEVILQCPNPEHKGERFYDKAVDLLTQATAKVQKPGDWNNPLLDAARAREIAERAIQFFRQANRFEVALGLTTVYQRLSAPPAALVLRGDLSADWARFRQEQAQQADGAARQTELDEAKKLFRQAAAAYDEAGKTDSAAGRLRNLWLSAISSQACGDDAQAVGKFEAYLKLETDAARLGEGYYRLGDCCRRSGNSELAMQYYRKCLDHQTRFAYLARHQLALMWLAAGDLDEAEGALVLNHKLLAFEPDAEALEKTLFTLGGLHYQRRKYRDAIRPLAEALHLYKDNPEAVRARFQLADSYRQIASQENQNALISVYKTQDALTWIQNEHRRYQRKAAEEFTGLWQLIERAKGKDGLTKEQRLQVPFFAAKCWFNAGEYAKALEIHEALILRHRKKHDPEELDALGGAIQCHAAMKDRDRVITRLLEIHQALEHHDEAIRQPWARWIEEARREIEGPRRPQSNLTSRDGAS